MFDISKIPFSMRGSYIAVSKYENNFDNMQNKAGIYLRTVHGLAYIPNSTMHSVPPFFAQIIPMYNGKEIEFDMKAEETEICISTDFGNIYLCFADEDTLLFKGNGKGLGTKLCLIDGNYAYNVGANGENHILLNCAANSRRFLMRNQIGITTLKKDNTDYFCNTITVNSDESDCFLFSIEDVLEEWNTSERHYSYEESKLQRDKEFSKFLKNTTLVSAEYEDTRRLAAYINWSCLVKAEGVLKREAMLMAKNWMCNVWAWDHCFNAIALSYHNPNLAWNQFMLMFDYQSETGRIPDCVSDTYAIWNFVKPPVHGWALLRMIQSMNLTEKQCAEAYDKLSKWTNWWLTYRDEDNDGICEYQHGNDAGWDNSTVFIENPVMELPDLSAFLIIQMGALSQLAKKLSKDSDAEKWQNRADEMLSAMLKHNFDGVQPKAVISGSHKKVESNSLILYLPILLGEKLPENIRKQMISVLKSERFFSEYGLATETVDSQLYVADGYWRGPIWAPSTLLLVDGLANCGEKEFAKEVAKRFCDMVAENGCAENFDALTGEGLRDKAYTWTSSVFLILAHDYLS